MGLTWFTDDFDIGVNIEKEEDVSKYKAGEGSFNNCLSISLSFIEDLFHIDTAMIFPHGHWE